MYQNKTKNYKKLIKFPHFFQINMVFIVHMATTKKIIIVDDEHDICLLLKTIIELHTKPDGSCVYETVLFNSGNDCIQYFDKGETADLVISDIRMSNGTGIDLLQHINQSMLKIPLFFISGFSGGPTDQDLIDMGAKKIFGKPFKKTDLMEGIQSVLNC